MKKTGRAKCFDKRDRVLKEIGFHSYKDYLKSSVWKSIRSKVFLKQNCLCQFCGQRATEVHHLNYTKEILLNGDYGLLSVCRDCHQKISDFAYLKKLHESVVYQLYNLAKKYHKSVFDCKRKTYQGMFRELTGKTHGK